MIAGCQSPREKGTSGDGAGIKGKDSQLIYSPPLRIKFQNQNTRPVLELVMIQPGSSIRDVQAGLHLNRGNPNHRELRWEVADILEVPGSCRLPQERGVVVLSHRKSPGDFAMTRRGKLFFVRDARGNYLESIRVWLFTPVWVRDSPEGREALKDGRIQIVLDEDCDENDVRNYYRDPKFRKEFNPGDKGEELW